MNIHVDFETAKLLKEKGFEQKIISYNYYLPNGNQVNFKYVANNKNYRDYSFYSPTIAETIMWLYEKHRIWINVYQYKDHAADVNDDYVFRSNYTKIKEYNSPTEAYEEAIEYTLKNLIK